MLCYAKSLQSCLTLCDPIDGSPTGSPVPGILQARTLEWVAISFSNAWKWKEKVKLLSRVRPLATPWTAAYQAPLSMGFSRQEFWSGFSCPPPAYLPDWGTESESLMLPELICRFFTISILFDLRRVEKRVEARPWDIAGTESEIWWQAERLSCLTVERNIVRKMIMLYIYL